MNIINPYRFGAGVTGFGNDSRDFVSTVPDFITTENFESVFQSSFTIAWWHKLDDGNPAAAEAFFAIRDSGTTNLLQCNVSTAGLVKFYYRSDNNNSIADLDTDLTNGAQSWIHYVWVVEPTGQTVYVNGSSATLDATNDGDMTGVTMASFVEDVLFPIGIRNLGGVFSQPMNGLMADFRIYSDALTSGEASDLHSGVDVTGNLEARWLGNDDNLLDLSGNDRDGYGLVPLYDNATFGDGSRYFPGVNDYVVVPSTTSTFNFVHDAKVFTVALWVRIGDHDAASIQTLVGTNTSISAGNYGWGAQYNNSTETKAFQFVINTSTDVGYEEILTATNSLSADGEWHHVAWTCSGTTLRFWLDGSEVTSTSVTATSIGNASNNLHMGIYPTTTPASSELEGYMADLRIYDVELVSGDLANIIAGTNVDGGDLQSHYFLNTDSMADSGALNLTATDNGTNFQTADAGTFSTDGPLD